MTVSKTVTFYRVEGYVYCEPDEEVANALTGGLGELIEMIIRQISEK